MMISCTAKQPTNITFYEGEYAGGIVRCGEMTAVINTPIEVIDKISDSTKIDILFLTALDGVHDSKAVEIINECNVAKIYLPKQTDVTDRYSAITSAVYAKNGTVIEVDGAKSLPFGQGELDVYYDFEMPSMTVGINANGKKALLCCGDISEKCFEYLSYKDAEYDIIGVEKTAAISSVCNRLKPDTLLVFATNRNSVSVSEAQASEILYSCETAVSVEY